MARKATPINVLDLKGKKHLTTAEIEARKEAEAAIASGTDKVKPPSWLSKAAKKEFRRQAKNLLEAKLITNSDVDLLAAYSDAYADYIKFAKIIEEEGEMIDKTSRSLKFGKDAQGKRTVVGETATVGKIPHPLLTKKRQAFDQMKAIALEFGFTPSARAKIAIPRKEKPEPTAFEKTFSNV